MKAKSYHRSTCRLCDSPNVELVVDLAAVPLAEKYVTEDQLGQRTDLYPIDLYMCKECGHVQILDVIDPNFLWQDYTYHSGQTRGIVEHFEKVADDVLGRYPQSANSLVVDIGSNDGSLLRPFKARGYRVLGIDPAKEIAQKATASGIETVAALMTPELARQIRQQHGSASIISAFNVFAHADDMAGMADSIKEMLDPSGIFLFEVQYLLDIVDRMLVGTIFHEHLCHHSVKPMQSFLKRHGMELIDVERVMIQKGSLIGTVQHLGGPLPVSPRVAEMVALEDARQLDQPATVRAFSQKIKRIKQKTQALIADWKRHGKSIAGYGAARSGPTLIAQFGLENVLDFVVDDHPQKINKFTPGHHFKVLPTEELCKRMPDYVVILAWIHAEKIIANNRQYLEQGGHFVVCTPEIQIVGADECVTFSAAA